MSEAEKTGRNTIKGKMGDRKEAENKTSSKSKWPLIKHKKNLQITRLKENDLFTVSTRLVSTLDDMLMEVLIWVAPAEGMVLHIHGDKCMLLEARNVTKGVKYIFHSDACFA
ncbi:hypothetical protein POTOM_042485 [Populus tomentosa]|uniref:Uncharacterized protein n=1 Tax=Populus tomentosa TaxID=118781 RepID=A0A8X8CA29_POPTO|nr:hypothetical protein POTOM_042485 [Populus tomentosa]